MNNNEKFREALDQMDIASLERLLELVREMVRLNVAQAEREAEACN